MRYLASLLLMFGLLTAPVYAGEPTVLDAPVVAVETAPPVAPVDVPAAPDADTPEAPAAAVPAVAETPDQIPTWLQTLIALISFAITAFLLPFLKRKTEAAKAEAKRQAAQATEHDINARGILLSRLKQFLWGTAESIAEKKFPELASKIKSGNIDSKAAIKMELHSWGGTLRSDAMSYFGNQGIDVIAAVGDDFLDKLIERAANAVSPFPGRETAKELLQDHATDWLIKHGVDWVRQRYLDTSMRGTDPAPVEAKP